MSHQFGDVKVFHTPRSFLFQKSSEVYVWRDILVTPAENSYIYRNGNSNYIK